MEIKKYSIADLFSCNLLRFHLLTLPAVRDADRASIGILEYLNVMDQIADVKFLPVLDRWKKYSPTAGRVSK